MKFLNKCWALILIVLIFPAPSFAHEVYVLTKSEIEQGFQKSVINPFAALFNPSNLQTFFIISLIIGLFLIFNFLFEHSRVGRLLSERWFYFKNFGQLVLRTAVAASFFYSAYSFDFLGPEVPLNLLPLWPVIHAMLYILGILILFGFFSQLAAFLSLLIFLIAGYALHFYVLTYVSYLGELIVLLLFGAGSFSLDSFFFTEKRYFSSWPKYEALIIRVCYGLALIYAAVNIKFLHPLLTLDVVNDYDLTRFHWLFPHDPLLVVLGAGLAEITIGLFILFGFQLRLTVLVTLFYITLSLIFFRELVWPHYILYGASIYLLISPNTYSLDSWFDRKILAWRSK